MMQYDFSAKSRVGWSECEKRRREGKEKQSEYTVEVLVVCTLIVLGLNFLWP